MSVTLGDRAGSESGRGNASMVSVEFSSTAGEQRDGVQADTASQRATKVRFLPLAVAYFLGLMALFTHVALTTVVTQTWITRAQTANDTVHDEGGKIPNGVATIPLACLIMMSSFIIPPVGWLMQRIGYQRCFYVGTILSMLSGALCVMTVYLFERRQVRPVVALALLTVSTMPQGWAYGIVHFYRHVAAVVGKATASELGMTPPQATARAIAIVITSGALAGVAGPGLADIFNDVVKGYPFVGTYASLIVVAALQLVCLLFVDVDSVFADPSNAPLIAAVAPEPTPPRPLCEIVRVPKFAGAMLTATAAHGMMLMIMTIAPLLLHGKVSFALSSLVIQVHVMCMYLPSYVTSKLVARFGTRPMEIVGVVVAAVGAAFLFIPDSNADTFYACVMVSLVLIGVGWNLTYVSATTSIAGVYRPEERFKAQSFNDFFVFSIGSVITLVSGTILHHFGLHVVAIITLVVYACTLIGHVAAALLGPAARSSD